MALIIILISTPASHNTYTHKNFPYKVSHETFCFCLLEWSDFAVVVVVVVVFVVVVAVAVFVVVAVVVGKLRKVPVVTRVVFSMSKSLQHYQQCLII